jgi:hypothetical protein
MAFQLQVSFGGLCLFTYDPDAHQSSPCWHVHMPALEDPGMEHYQRLLFSGAYVGVEGPQFADISGRAIDLTGLIAAGNKPDLSFLPWVSTFAGAPVDRQHALGMSPHSPLAARITLDSGIDVIPMGQRQLMTVGGGSTAKTFKATGLVSVKFQIDAKNLQIPELGLTFKPSHNPTTQEWEMFLLFGNLPADGYDPTNVHQFAQGQPAPHFFAYYKLVNGPKSMPIPEVGGPGPIVMEGMEPVTCMIAGGCQQGDPNCP